ncbi:MAG: hypothetical protein QXT84_04090 [Candidatus Bathyarchaeia archaeon]
MRKAAMLAILSLVALGAIIISFSIHGSLAYSGIPAVAKQMTERDDTIATWKYRGYTGNAQNFSRAFRCGWPPFGLKGPKRIEVELSEGFKEKVLSIVRADGDVQKLINEGYNVTDVRVMQMKLVVQENGQITLEASKALVVLANGNGGRAFVEVDVKAEKVTRIITMNIKVVKKE